MTYDTSLAMGQRGSEPICSAVFTRLCAMSLARDGCSHACKGVVFRYVSQSEKLAYCAS